VINLGFIVQARSRSKRLPNKVLLSIGEKNVLEHVISRIKKTKFKKKIIIATSSLKNDKKIIKCAKKNNCNYFSGDEKNVLQRYYLAAKKFKINTIIRISADSPFLDPLIIDSAFKIFKTNKYDYVSNIIKPSYPKGMSVEIFSFRCLEKTFSEAKTNSQKEHVTKFMYQSQNSFKTKNFGLQISLRQFKFAVDTKKDFLNAKKIYETLKKFKKHNSYNLRDLINAYKQIS
jgi:spore coat polysaccharide biosynthesis protein SpsF